MPVIAIDSMKFHAFVGYYPGEQKLGCEVEASVKLVLSSIVASHTDKIVDTIDYEDVYSIIREVFRERMNLLETAVKKIIDQIVHSYPTMESITVRIAKLNPPVRGRVEKVWVEEEWVRPH